MIEARHTSYQATFRRALDASYRGSFREIAAVKRGEAPWSSYYGSPVEAYDKEFRSVQAISIAEHLRKRKKEKGKVSALDVMGTTDFRAVAPVDRQAYMTLVNWEKNEDDNTVVFDGSILRSSPWMKSKHFQPEGYDLVTCRPLFGWRSLTAEGIVPKEHSNFIVGATMQRMVSSLNEGGVLLAQLPMFEDHRQWFSELNKVEGLDVAGDIFISERGYNRSVVQLQKNTKDRLQLPPIKDVNYFPNPLSST